MRLFGLTLTRTKSAVSSMTAASPLNPHWGGWTRILEANTGDWQRNIVTSTESVLTHPIVYACIRLIASDIGKLGLDLVAQDKNGIWTKTESPSFSPVLRRPNHYSTRNAFFEQWMFSKLIRANAYVLKGRDQRGVVTAMYVLDPSRVRVLVAPDGDVFYQLGRDDLAGQPKDSVTVPASEIIHDQMTAMFHPLAGISPLSAAGMAATQGLKIQESSSLFFGNNSTPGGILTAAGTIDPETAKRMRDDWQSNYSGPNYGRVAVLGNGLKFEPLAVKAVDSQLVEQWDATAHSICSAFGVPAFKVGVGPAPSYNNVEALNRGYYADCLQAHTEKIEALLDHGLELPKPYGTYFDKDDLILMDTAARVDAASKAVRAGMSPNEARFRFFDLGPVDGGDTPFMQQQDWPLALLAHRSSQELIGASVPNKAPVVVDDENVTEDEKSVTLADIRAAIVTKAAALFEGQAA